MFVNRMARAVRAFLLVLFAGFLVQLAMPESAEARAGGRRSIGRNSGRSAPAQQYRPAPQQQPNYQQPTQRGSFMRGMAAGVAGGVLGSMLFGGLAHGATGGLGGSGVGLIEILLLGLAAFLLFRWWKGRQQQHAMAGPQTYARDMSAAPYNLTPSAPSFGQSTARVSEDEASDLFFRVQGAYTRRDLSPIRSLLSEEVYAALSRDIEELKSRRQINRLENISVRRVEILDSWSEGDMEFVRVRFTANLLDYVVDEGSQQVIEGDAFEPVKFEEEWTLSKSRMLSGWQLAGIQQLS